MLVPMGYDVVLVGAARVTGDGLRAVAADAPDMLVRPDGVVAWVAGDGELEPALRRWFGDARVVSAVSATEKVDNFH